MVTPIDHDEFTASMEALGPFEPRPKLAVAVSGGGDSMALAILADQWARDRGGAVTALIVDHALRPGSADEAAMAGRWLKARRIARQVLVWSGPKPGTGRQEAAREARYALLTDWCRSKGVLHLLLAHHLEDQAETLLLRLGRGSGADGLAAMAALAESAALRFCRPLLGTAPARLRAFLEAEGQPWIEDPSNRDPGLRAGTVASGFANPFPAWAGTPAGLPAPRRNWDGCGKPSNAIQHDFSRAPRRSIRQVIAGWMKRG